MRKHMLSRTCILVFVALVTLHLLISYASAQILYVDEDAAGGSGTSWADAFNSLQAAISASQSGDEIWVVKGEYKPDEGSGNRTATFALKASTQLYGGFAGNETALEQRNWRVNETILSGDLNGDDTHTRTPLDQYYHGNYEENSYHIITISAGEPIIDGFIITGGNADGATPHNYGGGIRVFGTAVSPQIANCMFLANRANYGGAIHCEFSNPKILQCFFSANDAELTGGAIYYYAIDGYAFVLNSTFSNNDANGNHGDGIFFYSDTNDHSGGLLLQNSIFWGESIGVNSANKQIGVTNEGDESNYYLNVLYSTVQGGANAIEHDGVGETFDHILDGNPEFTDPDGTDDAAGTRDDNLHLQANSPCVDAGNNTFDADGGAVIDSDPVPLDVDFDLHGRIYNDTIDMGVYERTRMIHVNGGATGNNDGTNWRDAFRYLQDGLSAAQSGNEIWVAEGNYKPTYGVAQPGDTVEMKREYTFALKSGVGIYGGFTGTENERSERNWLANETILSGEINMKYETDNSYNVVTAIADETAIMDGFTIRHGYADNLSSYKFSRGAGIHGGNATIINCSIRSNVAIEGGGMFGRMSSIGSLFNCRFLSNQAQKGGGFHAEINSDFRLTNCSFLDNTADLGGAVYLEYGGSHLLTNCTISRNSAPSLGGGIYANSALATIYNSIIWGNTAAVDGHELALVNSQLEIFRSAIADGPQALYKDNGGYSGSYIVQSDPLFADTQGHLGSNSPCIDAGDNRAVPLDIIDIDDDGDTGERMPIDLDGLARFVDDPFTVDAGIADPSDYPQIVDMGAYERQRPLEICQADMDNDADVDAFDLEMFCANYGRTTCSGCPGDFMGDGDVDGTDFHTMVEEYGSTDCIVP